MRGQLPTAEAAPLSESTSDLGKMLHDYVKPTFVRLNAENRAKVMEIMNKMVTDQGA